MAWPRTGGSCGWLPTLSPQISGSCGGSPTLSHTICGFGPKSRVAAVGRPRSPMRSMALPQISGSCGWSPALSYAILAWPQSRVTSVDRPRSPTGFGLCHKSQVAAIGSRIMTAAKNDARCSAACSCQESLSMLNAKMIDCVLLLQQWCSCSWYEKVLCDVVAASICISEPLPVTLAQLVLRILRALPVLLALRA